MDLGDIASIGYASRSAGTATSDAPRSGCGRVKPVMFEYTGFIRSHTTAQRLPCQLANHFWSHARTDAKLEDAERVAEVLSRLDDRNCLAYHQLSAVIDAAALLRRIPEMQKHI